MITSTASYKYSIRLLAKRDYGIFKLTKKLNEKGFEPIEIDELITYLIQKKWLREDLYIEARIKGYLHKNLAISNIQMKLRDENISLSEEEIQSFMDEQEVSTDQQISNLIEKKTRYLTQEELTDSNKKSKILRFLLSKGHDYERCKNLLETRLLNAQQH